MQFLTFLALAAAAAAAPAPSDTSSSMNIPNQPYNGTIRAVADGASEYFEKNSGHIQRRDANVVPGVYVCEGPGFQNNCVWQQMVSMTCMALPKSPNLAVGPDADIQCRFYADQNCDDEAGYTSGTATFPGVTNFYTYEDFGKIPLAYRCHPCEDKGCGVTVKTYYWEPPKCPFTHSWIC